MIKEKFIKLETIEERVRLLLEEMPTVRDSDNLLFATFILYEVGDEIKEMSALDLLAKISKNRISSFSTISRVRAEIQKNVEELRGSVYGKRKKRPEIPLFVINQRDK